MQKFFKQKNKGFTLVETLVAIAIFTTSILSLMVILGNGISNTTYAKQKITAEYLAQEGIEYVRNMRDTFNLYSVSSNSLIGWDAFKKKLLLASCDQLAGCYFGDLNALDFTNPSYPMTGIAITACTPTCPRLKYDSTIGSPTIGRYNYTNGADSAFTRTITITCPVTNDCTVPTDEIKITSVVSWTQGSGHYSATFSENLFNWIKP